jgi:hypothetical protein
MNAKNFQKRSLPRVERRRQHSSEVGYGRPPAEHRFKAGRSGNPKGRPNGAKSETTILRELLNRKIEIREGGKVRKITVLEAILLRFTEAALKGNTKTAAFLFDRYERHEDSHPGTDSSQLSASERKVLDDFTRRLEATLGDRT